MMYIMTRPFHLLYMETKMGIITIYMSAALCFIVHARTPTYLRCYLSLTHYAISEYDLHRFRYIDWAYILSGQLL